MTTRIVTIKGLVVAVIMALWLPVTTSWLTIMMAPPLCGEGRWVSTRRNRMAQQPPYSSVPHGQHLVYYGFWTLYAATDYQASSSSTSSRSKASNSKSSQKSKSLSSSTTTTACSPSSLASANLHPHQQTNALFDDQSDGMTSELRRNALFAAMSTMFVGPVAMELSNTMTGEAGSSGSTLVGAVTTALSTETITALQAGDAIVRNLWLGRLAYPVLIVALEMGLFTCLGNAANGNRPGLTMAQLGPQLQPPLSMTRNAEGDGTESPPRSLQAMVAVLTSLGLLQITPGDRIQDDRIQLTEAARLVLLPQSPYYWGSQLLAADGVTALLRRAVTRESRYGSTASTAAYVAHSDATIDSFIDSMQSHSSITAQATAKVLVEQGYFDRSKTNDGSSSPSPYSVLDMAGGSGCFAVALARWVPQLHVWLADVPRVVQSWQEQRQYHVAPSQSVRRRIHSVPCDMFQPWNNLIPTTATTGNSKPEHIFDTVLLANVLHDWGEAEVLTILRHAREALLAQQQQASIAFVSPTAKSGTDNNNRSKEFQGRVLIVEQLMQHHGTGPLPASLASISMLLGDWRTGKQYSFHELEHLVQEAGFARIELGPACGAFHHVVACYIDSTTATT